MTELVTDQVFSPIFSSFAPFKKSWTHPCAVIKNLQNCLQIYLVTKVLAVLDPKYPKTVIFVFAHLRICIFLLVFVFGLREKSSVCTFTHNNWICIEN